MSEMERPRPLMGCQKKRITRMSKSSGLEQWVRAAAGKRVLLVGDLILDRYLYGDAERISPEAPVPVLRTVEAREAVGGSANVAACLRALGCAVHCVGTIGRDAHGQRLLDLLNELGIDTTGVLRLSDRPTTTKTRLVGLAQHRHRQQLLRVDEEDTRPLPGPQARQLRETVCAAASQVDIICLEDYDKGVLSGDLVRAVVSAARPRGIRILVDPARLSDYSRYAGASVLTPNRGELALATGADRSDLTKLATAAQKLLADQDCEAAVVTVDREGALVVPRAGEWERVPTVPRSVYDNTGAGDAVLAMLAAALAAGADLLDATRLANVAGGLEVERFGCVPITAEEVLADLRLGQRLRDTKLRSLEELQAELQLRRDRGETIAFTNGCFDLLHAGHVDYLKRCRQEASVLVLGLNSDASVRAQSKGEDRPIVPFEQRAAVLGALECIDYVVGFEEPTPERLIEAVRPDVLVKGEDWANKGVVGQTFVESYGGRVVLAPLVEGLSTTALLERIRGGGSAANRPAASPEGDRA
jgi:D-beta-D-heptose 7-phosphate kinase/D-beta-D-heptose 1-phosphate adenosyltransferase